MFLKTRFIALILATMLVFLAMAPPAHAGRDGGKLPLMSREASAKRMQNLEEEKQSMANGKVVQLQGTLDYSSSRGLRLDGMAVLLDGSTGVFPSSSTRLPRPEMLDDRAVTIFGYRTSRGVRATLVIVREKDHFEGGVETRVDLGRPYLKPSDSDPSVGELTGDAPQ